MSVKEVLKKNPTSHFARFEDILDYPAAELFSSATDDNLSEKADAIVDWLSRFMVSNGKNQPMQPHPGTIVSYLGGIRGKLRQHNTLLLEYLDQKDIKMKESFLFSRPPCFRWLFR